MQTRAVGALYGVRYTDMGAFRAIRRDALDRLALREMTYGWKIEMQECRRRAPGFASSRSVLTAPRRRYVEGRGLARRIAARIEDGGSP